MADKNDGGDKTEQPTAKKLLDARKKGQVPKSKDVTSTVSLLVWFMLAALVLGYAASRFIALAELALHAVLQPFALAAPAVAGAALEVLLVLTAVSLLPVAAVGMLTEFLQTGPVLSFESVKPKLENMNPVEGVKRMFSIDNLVELAKAAAKTCALLAIGWLAIKALLPQLALLPASRRPEQVGIALWETARPLLVWTIALFVLLSLLDAVYQRWSFTKKMRMSRRDIRQELKDNEGDPYVKAQRRQTQEEAAQQGAAAAARHANVLVVNPTHVAIAIDYDRQTCPVPALAAKGEDELARIMREAAEEAGVPIIRNVPLARDLLARGEVGELIPPDLFDVIADVILWARDVRDGAERNAARPARPAPGEDLSRDALARTAAAAPPPSPTAWSPT